MGIGASCKPLRPHALYLQAFTDGGGTIGTDAEAAIDRYYSTPQQYYGGQKS
jgi:hypothetical protein